MQEWKTYRIGDICKRVCSGGTPKSTEPSYYDGEIPWLNTKEINFNRISSTEKHITLSGLENSSAKWIDKNSVIVAMYGATAAKVAINTIPLTTNQACCNLSIDETKADYRFVYYWLCSRYSELASLANGGAQQNLNAQQIKDFEIKLPEIQTQQKIADLLWSIDNKIICNKSINDNLEQQAQTLYKSWFVDFEPFKDGEFIESELGQIPEGWQCIPFSMFVSESKAKTGKIGIKEYSVTNNGIFPRDAKYNKSLSQSSTKNKLILYGDLVFGMSRDILNWGVMQEEQGGVSSAYTVYNINSGIVNSTYLELFIKSRIHLFSDLIRPAAREGQGIDKSVLQTKVLLCPPQEVLDTFWPLYNSVTNQIQTTTTEINCLGDVRDTLLPKLMSGELKINEIDC